MIRFLNQFILLGFIIFLLACSSKTGPVCCGPPNANVEISIVDSQGADRLDPNHSHSVTEQSLDLYHVDETEKQRFSTGIAIYEGEDIFIMQLTLSNHVEDDGNTTTLIEFADGTVDTVTMEPLNEDANSARRLWHDGELVWENDSEYTMPIEIIKPVASD